MHDERHATVLSSHRVAPGCIERAVHACANPRRGVRGSVLVKMTVAELADQTREELVERRLGAPTIVAAGRVK